MAVTRARLNSYRADVDACGEAAAAYVEQYLAAIMAEYPGISVAELREVAIEAIEDSLDAFGDQAAELALELFEEIAGTGHDAQIYDVIDPERIDGKVRYYARSLVEGDVASFSRDVSDLTRYYVKRSAFENMAENCGRGEVRYARVPSGSETCPFCFMLSSRGFVYHTAESAGEGHPYHRNCDCVIVPGVKGLDPDSQIEGYRPTELYRRWKGCAGTVGEDPDTRDAAALGRIRAEVATRDWRWLYEGRVPEITFETDALRQEIERDRPHEIETAKRLREFGIAPDFVVDSIEYVDEETGLVQFVGLADFASGYEIKSLESASSYNTINGYLKNTSHKENAKYVCFDNSSGAIDDATLVEYIQRSRSFRRGRVYIIDSSGRYRFIR